MKKILICAMAALAIMSCKSNVEEPTDTQEVTFQLQNLNVSTETIDGMASPIRKTSTPKDAGLTDIWVLDGTTELCHQKSTNNNFGTPTISLKYGQHTLTFIGSKSENQSVTNGVWSADSPNNTFAYKYDLNVTSSTGSQQIELQRAFYSLIWQSEDVVPSNACSLEVVISEYYPSLNYDLTGSGKVTDKSFKYDITGKVGKTLTVTCNAFAPTFNVEDKNFVSTCTITDSNGATIITHTVTEVPILTNRKTTISGNFFGWSSSAPIKVNDTWEKDATITL